MTVLGGAVGLLSVVEQTSYVNAQPVNHPVCMHWTWQQARLASQWQLLEIH